VGLANKERTIPGNRGGNSFGAHFGYALGTGGGGSEMRV